MKFFMSPAIVAVIVGFSLVSQAGNQVLDCKEEEGKQRQVQLTWPDDMNEGDVAACEVTIKDRAGRVLLVQPAECTEAEDVQFFVNAKANGVILHWSIFQDELYDSTLELEIRGMQDSLRLTCGE